MIRNEIQDESTQSIITNDFNGIVDVAPRVGKTKIILDALREFDGTIGVIYPYTTVKDSWLAEIKKWKFKKPIVFRNQRSISNLPETDITISDECHTLSPLQLLRYTGRSGLKLMATGSLSKSTLSNFKEHMDIDIIHRYDFEQAIADGIIADYRIYIAPVKLGRKHRVSIGSKRNPRSMYEENAYKYATKNFMRAKRDAIDDPSQYQWKNYWARKRANMIYECPSKIEMANHIRSKIKERSITFTVLTKVADQLGECAYHSKSDKNMLDMFVDQKCDHLAVCNMVSMGVTIPNLKRAVFHQLQSNDEMAVQKCLRTMNLEDDRMAKIYVCTAWDTVDQDWTTSALSMFDSNKIRMLNKNELN